MSRSTKETENRDSKKRRSKLENIDQQHDQLADRVGELFNAIQVAADPQLILRTLESLTQESRQHFAYEEQLMRKHSYPNYDSHLQEHQSLLVELENIVIEISANSTALNLETLLYLRGWLLGHLEEQDRDFINFMAQSTQPKPAPHGFAGNEEFH